MSGQKLNLWELVLPLDVVCRLSTGYSVGPSCIEAMMADAARLGIVFALYQPGEFSSAASLLLFCSHMKVLLSHTF